MVASAAQRPNRIVGVHAVGAAAVGDDLLTFGYVAQSPGQLCHGDRQGSGDVSGPELGLGSHIEHDHVPGPQSLRQLVASDGVQSGPVTEAGRGELVEFLDMLGRYHPNDRPELGYAFAGQ